jgi:hypothetical protein
VAGRLGISQDMRGVFQRGPFIHGGLRTCLLLCLVLLASRSVRSAEGIFQGKVVDPPVDEPVRPGWIFVQGGNHSLRRVEVAHAVIVFGQQVPSSQRRKCGPECLEVGQEIRVTANQDSAGEWRASRVEILRLTAHTTQTALAGSTRSPQNAGFWGLDGSGPFDLTKLNTDSGRGCWITIVGGGSI